MGGSFEIFNLAWKSQSRRAILKFLNLWALGDIARYGATKGVKASAPWLKCSDSSKIMKQAPFEDSPLIKGFGGWLA